MNTKTRSIFGLIFTALLIGAAFSGSGSGQTASLSGEQAVKHLRETGEYNSLRAAFDAARKDGGDGPLSPEVSETQLTASDGAANDRLGRSVAVSGETAIVGSHLDDIGANIDQGSAYVFVRSGTTWTRQAKLTASDGAANDLFGNSVGISGETVIIGSHLDDIGSSAQGSAYVFVRSGTTWTQQTKLMAADGAAGDSFGISVAVSGEIAVVGAERDDIGAYTDEGSAYVFVRSGTTWTQRPKLIASDSAVGDLFGGSVAVSGETVIIGSQGDDIGANSNQGSAYVYVRSGANWVHQTKLTVLGGAVNDFFGISVAVSGETAIVGSVGVDIGANADQGAAHVFVRNGTTWTRQTRLVALDGAADDLFGGSVAISGGTAIVGSPEDNIGANINQGSAYVFNSLSTHTLYDFDGDGKADISVFRPSNGVWYLQRSQLGFTGIAFGQTGDKIVPADYDGDGKTDVAVYRNGTWYLQRSSLGFTGVAFGEANDIPMPADYDGDGKADIAVFRPSNGVWYLQRSQLGFTGIAFGQNGDKPVAADYDGDGKTDVAVFRPSNGTWYLQRSQLGFIGAAFGFGTDLPVPADYDGDSKVDIAVFRPSNGVWYLQRSSLGFTSNSFGFGTDLPAPADYDGDGKSDIAVFRSSNGVWYLNRSTQGFTGAAFGAAEDKPAPNAFIP